MTGIDPRPGVVWFRRDLRLDDNPAWAAATAAHDEVIAPFVLEPKLMDAAGQIRRDQLLAHLDALHEHLKDLGGGLVVRFGPAAAAIPVAVADCEASALNFNVDVTPFSTERDEAVAKAVAIPTRGFNGLTVHEPGAVLTKNGQPVPGFHTFLQGLDRGLVNSVALTGRGPTSCHVGRIDSYAARTDLPATRRVRSVAASHRLARTCRRLSRHPRLTCDCRYFGTLGRSQVRHPRRPHPYRCSRHRQGGSRCVRAAGRVADWWAHTLALRPDLPDVALKPKYDNIAWRDDPEGFQRWCAGLTGYLIVDTGMRQLSQTGWMHNPVRMICASFLVKDLLIDWRKGERFFRHHLVDADIAQNAGNWQWVAGTGPDAAPYFRVFNPTTQGEKFDPQGDYVRRWVPELSGLPTSAIHQPQSFDPSKLATAGVVLGDTYPAPVIVHAAARTRALQTYKRALG